MNQKPAAVRRVETGRTNAPAQAPNVRNWTGIIAVSTLISIAAIAIGTHKFQLGPAALVLFPIIWAVVIGGIVGVQKVRPITPSGRSVATVLLEVGIVMFLAGLGAQIGPSLSKFAEIGPAIALQEIGHIVGTVIIALPVAVGLGLGRASIGATWSIDRESFLAYAIQKFGVRSAEYRGVFSVWLLGSLFGAVFISLLAGLLGGLEIFDPRALALGLGLGSASMMLGGVGALSLLYPEMAGEILALAALSNLVTNIVGFYAGVFIALPMCKSLYNFWKRVFGKDDEGRSTRRLAADASESSAAGRKPKREVKLEVEADPVIKRTPKVMLLALLVAGLTGALMNALGTKSFEPKDLLGIGLFMVLTLVAFTVAKYVPSVPSSVWVLALGTLLSAPFMPTASFVADVIGNLDVIMIGLASLTLIGLTLGRDIAAIRTLGWRIVVVALLTYSASFIAAAAIAQFTLHL
ncbi:DUF3100 domain-containing protein [Paeniglutamicibacter cryotolerans]|uniref:DUF3100 domain-containing protein n=1 Tax=Paeniglutamicibacter cryotolerans TaxID=670079 RepID=A0A839QGT7_9MICC|nr:DUF3100 domain-containing protein [Paeniglutamicibacter cryotolerans]MBB2995110.1 hypothetical protein [Paeniglutamicibacter cryotolerans]